MAKNSKIRVAINGFGRIGRAAFKIALANPNIQIVAINDLADANTLAHLLKYDTAYGKYDKKVLQGAGYISVNNKKYSITAVKDPAKLPWKKMKIDVVLECTGIFRKESELAKHIKAGAKKVLLSAPAKGAGINTFVLGVNEQKYGNEKYINNASCTTNCVALVAQVIHNAFGVSKAAMTTIHSYTAGQKLQDGPHKDLYRARAAAQNIVPTTTGAATATANVIPELAGLFDGIAVRVPTIVGSLTDITFVTKKKTTVKQVNASLIKASKSAKLKNILKVTTDPLVSSDIIGESASAVVDLNMTQVIDGDLVKIIAWYDNEWGYASRLVEMINQVYK
jgi:glyceraldehyde 3-phosphate dehydrogenase (phosphorylating)